MITVRQWQIINVINGQAVLSPFLRIKRHKYNISVYGIHISLLLLTPPQRQW